MIIITGAAGFIGSCMLSKLNEENYLDIIAVDSFQRQDKSKNLASKSISEEIDREKFFSWLENHHQGVQFVFHLGARTDTTEFDMEILNHLNLEYSKKMFAACAKYGIPLIYASSAATYGNGSYGYSDNHDLIRKLVPLNPYGVSKNEFDKWVLDEENQPPYWVGLKFFNVYGPNEYHKGRMASVVYHAFRQISNEGKIQLFKSHRKNYAHGEQKRDFIYVKDVVNTMFYLMHNRIQTYNGIYNLGTGKAQTFNELAAAIFRSLNREENIEYIDTPKDIRGKYQYFTEAKMEKLRTMGYDKKFLSLSEGVEDYVKNYLLLSQHY
jgi:ADP-L-glycero-D-manno-heptose 6-epimerase